MATVYRKAINPGPYRNMQYDPVRDFAPIAQVGVTPTLLGVHPSLPATDVKSLVALVKDNAGKFSYGSFRRRSVLHRLGEVSHGHSAGGTLRDATPRRRPRPRAQAVDLP